MALSGGDWFSVTDLVLSHLWLVRLSCIQFNAFFMEGFSETVALTLLVLSLNQLILQPRLFNVPNFVNV